LSAVEAVMPSWLRQPDADWRGFSAAEADALAEMRREWALMGTADRFHAGVPVLRDDGAASIKPLTVERVETYSALYWERRWSESFVLTPRQDA
jgi:hypothetical protein